MGSEIMSINLPLYKKADVRPPNIFLSPALKFVCPYLIKVVREMKGDH